MKTITTMALAALAFAAPASAQDASPDLLARGQAVAIAGDCAACHTAPRGGKPFAGGYAIKSPMGDIISTNITPSKTQGIGGWSEADFTRALREGVSPHGRLYPAMPYTAYARMSDADVHALWTYINHSVASVDVAPKAETSLSFPFNIRAMMIGWDMLFAGGKPDAGKDIEPGGARRGDYLVNGAAHCGTCHTPRNLFMAEKSGSFLAGADVGGWHAPNITSDPVAGIGGWSEDEIVTYLREGAVHGKAQAAGPMAEAVSFSFSKMSDDDLHAIARYLKTVPAANESGAVAPSYTVTGALPAKLGDLDAAIDRSPAAMIDGSSTDGQRIYMGACATCHQMNGTGTQDQFYPSLTRNTATGGMTAANLVMAILEGVHRETGHGTVAMPAFARELNDAQVAAVSNYVLTRFGNHALKVSAGDVAQLRAGGPVPLLVRSVPWLLALAAAVILLVGLRIRKRRRG